ncbi:MAG: hypothetical protein ACE5K4_00545 [Candidatus Hydrothermarchaeota archaeon]
MRCVVCGKITERGNTEHIRFEHVEPLGVTQKEIFEHAKKIAYPIEVKTAYTTCINLKENIIYFSIDNAELSIAFASEHYDVPWKHVVEWQILHEKGHITCRELYPPPVPFRPYVVVNVEDYYINKYLIPQKYWIVCIANARCSTLIRKLIPTPYELRDGYYYCSLATFLAFDAVSKEDFSFLKTSESTFVGKIAEALTDIKDSEDILTANNKIGEIFDNLYPPRGISWDEWEILE